MPTLPKSTTTCSSGPYVPVGDRVIDQAGKLRLTTGNELSRLQLRSMDSAGSSICVWVCLVGEKVCILVL